MMKRLVSRLARFALLAFSLGLGGCQFFGSSASINYPGSFSYYSVVTFDSENSLCDSFSNSPEYAQCFYGVRNDLGSPLNLTWTLDTGMTDGIINGVQTAAITASQFANDTSNLVYISSHGYVNSGQSYICLRSCTGGADYGGTTAISTADTANIPNAWNGPNWLIVDACAVVDKNQGWESKFGGNLHGVLGFSVAADGTTSGLGTLAKNINSYSMTALQSWAGAIVNSRSNQQIGMVIPNANAGDYIEGSNGPNFGTSGNTFGSYYDYEGIPGGMAVTQPSGMNTASVYSLAPEAVDESQWYSLYGNPAGAKSTPNSNEHDFVSATAIVSHYLASGGVFAEAPASGTAGAISQQAAYQFALSFIANNGGLPADAILSYAGQTTNPNSNVVIQQPTSVTAADFPEFTNVRDWVFIWRHKKSGILLGDKIQVNVDDAGYWTAVPELCAVKGQIVIVNPGQPPAPLGTCHVPPWNSSPQVEFYDRVWRTLGAATASVATSTPNSPTSKAKQSIAGLCASAIDDPVSQARPCQEFLDTPDSVRYYVDLGTGASVGSF
jgi:hypothetical protein